MFRYALFLFLTLAPVPTHLMRDDPTREPFPVGTTYDLYDSQGEYAGFLVVAKIEWPPFATAKRYRVWIFNWSNGSSHDQYWNGPLLEMARNVHRVKSGRD